MTFYDEEKELLKYYLNANIFHHGNSAEYILDHYSDIETFKDKFTICSVRPASDYLNIELIVRPECNQNCKYCYIAQHGKELYPIEERVDNQTILKNLRSLLDYIYIKYDLFIGDFELFAGDMFYDGLYFDILDVFYEFLEKEHIKWPKLYDINSKHPMVIGAPVNMSFILNDKAVKRFDEYYWKFRDIGVEIWLSASTDGPYAVNTREQRPLPENYFKKVFDFCKKYHFFFHPMVSALNVKNWIQNYDWWKREIAHYNFVEDLGPGAYIPMMLEVRNNDWNDESIDAFIDFVNHMYEDRFDMNDRDPKKMAYHLFSGGGEEGSLPVIPAYDIIRMVTETINEGILCTVQTSLHVTLNNLSIIPSHRTAYKQFIAGRFITSNDIQNKIIDIEPGNVNALMTILDMRRFVMPKCYDCDVQPVCPGGCMGAQYENSGELLFPNSTCCKMFRKKFAFLVYKLEKTGVFQYGKDYGLIAPSLLEVIETIKELDEYKEFIAKDEY